MREEKIDLIVDIYKKTLGYQLESVKLNDDGTFTHTHSGAFLEEHPERKDNPEFTEDEELEQARLLKTMAEELHKKHPDSLFR